MKNPIKYLLPTEISRTLSRVYQSVLKSVRKKMSDKDHDKEENDSASGEKKPSLLEQTTSKMSSSEFLRSLNRMTVSDGPKPESRLEEVTFKGIAKYILSDRCQKIVTLAGAGISTSAGIPDFRSPGTGIYDNLAKYDLPQPESVFDIGYFRENPEPFFALSKELYPGKVKPTPCHYFIKLLSDKKKLLRHFTQNIDTLERLAGLTDDKVVEAHGTYNTSHCLKCDKLYSQEWMSEKILDKSPGVIVPKCELEDCDGVVKPEQSLVLMSPTIIVGTGEYPDIVFFGESLPKKFADHLSDLEDCDMLIIMGTSLAVQPFSMLPSRVNEDIPRLYINLEKHSMAMNPFLMMLMGGGCRFNFDDEGNIRDVFWQGTCDDGCYALADLLGWGDELRKMVKSEHDRLDKVFKEEEKRKEKKDRGQGKEAKAKV